MSNGDLFSADPDGVKRGGNELKKLSDLIADVHGELFAITDEHGKDLGGNGEIGDSFKTNYFPAADACLKFLKEMGSLVDEHGDSTTQLGDLFDDVDTTATDVAHNSGRH